MQMTQRVRISTGLQCNAQCLFCYYQQELNTQTYTTLQIKQAMDLAKRYGIQDIDFSGGEPTLRKDLVDLVRYARSTGFQTISVITNGTRTNVFSYMEKLQKAGINDKILAKGRL
ncbi:MAG: radical SAM protein [Desulfosarcinaceae bacterium]